MRSVLAAAVALFPLVAVAQQAPSGPPCMPRDALVAVLEQQYSEVPVAAAVTESGMAMEVFARPDGETWTLVLTRPGGVSCLVASGSAWQAIVPVAAGRGA